MKLDDDFSNDNFYENDKHSSGNSLIYAVAAVSLIFLCVIVLVLAVNVKPSRSISAGAVQNTVYETDDTVVSGDGIHVDDLDFWHDYDDTKTPEPEQPALTVEPEEPPVIDDPSTDGKHTLIKYKDGTEEWLEINPYLALNTYNNANFVYVNNIMKYYENSVNVSFAGVDLSRNNDYVDFTRVKNAGIDFCMLRIGQRGFVSGEISIDENFQDNYDRASDAGLDIGVYFFSQAITKEEAVEEANFVIETLSENKINYPVVFYMEDINSSGVRTDTLTQMERTYIAIEFMSTIREAGYVPMIGGNKEYLLKKISFGSLIGYDIWLCQDGDTPDFPYEYSMWRYDSTANIAGISGYADVDICFTDYSLR